MRVLFDTNVVVAGIVAEGLCREILEIHVPEHTAILSQVLWDALLATLRRNFSLAPDALPILGLYRRHAEWCEPLALPAAVCRDSDDDWVLATAVAGDAAVIVSGDADLLTLDHYSGIKIVSPRQFVGQQASSGRG